MENDQNANDKLISGLTARKYLKCSKVEFEKLVKRGVIQAFRDEANRWRVSKESVLNYIKPSLPSQGTHLIINNDHYQKVVQRICDAKRNHAKAIIIDDKLAYIGSANITPAGLGQGIFTPGNFETGMLTDDSSIVTPLMELFSKIWSGSYCAGCHRADKCKKIKIGRANIEVNPVS